MIVREKTEQLKQQIIEAADQLFYKKGYNLTSFSDIAAISKIPRGNLNYYFKTKDEVLIAVIEYRVNEMKLMLQGWEEEFKTPIERLQRYVKIIANVKNEVIKYGCPMGSLNSELGKVQRELQIISREQFSVFENWIKKQFQVMGWGKKSGDLAMHLMVLTQGLATMAYIHKDTRLIKKELNFTSSWLISLSKEENK
ncbi:hypothetical protein MNBD_GAMMA12-3951 [hydrothermal vent metagenome]|uniref:HTH tetR-type domain-containing protein n=1 Tax=hydrothermal vent metagenome TaxID=652676 RepID=A0A3B0Z252_9ZZZZ